MSLQSISDPVKLSERICEGCGHPIIRNLASCDLKLYHYGCLKKTKAKPTHQCTNCFAYWTHGKLTTIIYDDGATREKICPACGYASLRPLRTAAW
jgi:hypothetical protein